MNLQDSRPRLSVEYIDYHALGMVKHLQKAGHTAYLVGGCVRDLLVGHIPKDFDIGTSAFPQQVKRLIGFSFIIGKRFRLVLVKRDDKQYEVATFRREPQPDEFPEGAPFGDNIFGTPEQDAIRRDFTINAIFYDPMADKVIDYAGGRADIESRVIRMIGNPDVRLVEDPIRILRAIRFAHKLEFSIDSELRHSMAQHSDKLLTSVLPRRREEYLKLLRLPDPAAVFREGYDLNLWKTAVPELHKIFESEDYLDIFEDRLQRLPGRLVESSDTPLLFGTLILGWLRSKMHSTDRVIEHKHTMGNQSLNHLMKDQLGLHNWETNNILKAISMHKLMADPSNFKHKHDKRRLSFISSEVFPLAVDLAHIDGVFDEEVLDYWDVQLAESLEMRLELQNQKHLTRHRGPKRKGRR